MELNNTHLPTPSYVQMEPVGQCNLRCQMCPIQFRMDGPPYGPLAFMDFDLYCRLVDGFTNLKELHLQGLGEPMMHPRYFDMVEYAANKGIRVTTNSNLTLLSPSKAERCVRSGLEVLHVSVDGATAETYERIRKRARLDRVLHNLESLLEVRSRAGSNQPHLKMVMVIMRQNLDELPDLVRLANRYQMEEVFVQHLAHDFAESSLPAHYRPMREFVEEQTLYNVDENRVAERFAEARKVANELGIHIRLPNTRFKVHPHGTPGRERCSWPWTGAYISYSGDSMPCCMIATPDRGTLGNLNHHSVDEVWNGPAYQEFRRQLSSDTPPEVCKTCSIYTGTF